MMAMVMALAVAYVMTTVGSATTHAAPLSYDLLSSPQTRAVRSPVVAVACLCLPDLLWGGASQRALHTGFLSLLSLLLVVQEQPGQESHAYGHDGPSRQDQHRWLHQ